MPTQLFTHTDYYTASESRYYDLHHLRKDTNSTIFSLYCAGVVIECMLRAYITRYTREFDSKHDLLKLYVKSRLASYLNDDAEKLKLTVAITKAGKIWKNDLRYASQKRMKRIIAHEIVKTKFVDINKYILIRNKDLIEATELIYKTGKSKWT